jgi:predicted deacylase
MRPLSAKLIIVGAIAILAVALGVFFMLRGREEADEPIVATTTPETVRHAVIGTSVQGRPIESFSYGTGTTTLLFVGGIHGGYEWNSILLAYTAMDHLTANPELIPKNLTVTIVPNANPDGVFKIIGKEGRFALADVPAVDASAGRFNANGVDLNRNFDCKWQATSTWRSQTVSAGTSAFSEPEARAIRDIVLAERPIAVVFWHSQSNAVYASECEAGILPGTRTLMTTYASAAGYPAVDTFDAYAITGDAEGWLASQGIPAVTVELSTHQTIEWEKNLAGMKALFAAYAR